MSAIAGQAANSMRANKVRWIFIIALLRKTASTYAALLTLKSLQQSCDYLQFPAPASHIDLWNGELGHIRGFQRSASCANSKRSQIRRIAAIQGVGANPPPIKPASASMASFSSGPLVSMVIVLPTPAASNITARGLRALALRPCAASHTLQLNLAATCAILAAGRA